MNNLEKLSTFLTFAILIVGVTSIWTDYRLVNQEGGYSLRKPTCTVPGLMCDGCKDVYFCDDKNRPSKSQTCNATQNCENGRCTNTPTFQCSPAGRIEFQCEMEGIFPDPGDCFKYHICVSTTDSDDFVEKSNDARKCRNLFSYNPRTTYCDIKLPTAVCPTYPVPLCTAPLQSGPLKDNPSIYYICQVYEKGSSEPTITTVSPKEDILYPYLRICKNGKKYDAARYICV